MHQLCERKRINILLSTKCKRSDSIHKKENIKFINNRQSEKESRTSKSAKDKATIEINDLIVQRDQLQFDSVIVVIGGVRENIVLESDPSRNKAYIGILFVKNREQQRQ